MYVAWEQDKLINCGMSKREYSEPQNTIMKAVNMSSHSSKLSRLGQDLARAAIAFALPAIWTQAHAANAMLRIACDGPAVNAEVTINGEFKGDCPVDVPLAAGSLRIRVMKKVDSERELVFEQEVRMVAGTVKRIDVEFGAPQLNAAAQRLATQRAAAAQAEAERAAAVRAAAVAAARAEAERAAAARAVVEAKAAAQSAAFIAEPGRTFKDCADCPEMQVIPSGSFQMGSNAAEQAQANAAGLRKNFTDAENPQRSVNIKSFAIGRYEVTQAQWKSVMGSNPSSFKNCGDTCPVESVSWNDVQKFIEKLNAKTGKIYRLPSESEWEYACRAGANHIYCGGNDADGVAVYKNNSGSRTHPTGSKQANAWGLYDMSGNVWEWVQDCWNHSYNGAPIDGSAWTSGDCGSRVLRSGSWKDGLGTRAAFRFSLESPLQFHGSGFRLARIAP